MKRSREQPKQKKAKNLSSPKALREHARRLLARADAHQRKMQKHIDYLRREASAWIEAAENVEAAREKRRAGGEQQGRTALDGEHGDADGIVRPGEHVLRERSHGATVNRMLDAEHVLAISKGKTKREQGEADALVLAAQRAGLSLRALSRAVGKKVRRNVPVSRLSMARRGDRPIDADIAAAIKQLTGFDDSARNWPGGIARP